MQKKVLGIALISGFLLLSVTGLPADFAAADPIPFEEFPILPEITIHVDGTITPDIGYIAKNGNTYTLTTDLINQYSIAISCNNIVFDGEGHIINVYEGRGGLSLTGVTNVTVKNLEIFSNFDAIFLGSGCTDCLIVGIKSDKPISLFGHSNFNIVTECNVKIYISGSYNNYIIKNNVTRLDIFSHSNLFYCNNFILDSLPSISGDNSWSNGSMGNYWTNYTTRYPHAEEISHSGIGNIPFEVESKFPATNNTDYYPLMYPYDIVKDQIALPVSETDAAVHLSITVLAVGASTALIVGGAVAVGLFYYRRHSGKV
jgi:hypothetical protein